MSPRIPIGVAEDYKQNLKPNFAGLPRPSPAWVYNSIYNRMEVKAEPSPISNKYNNLGYFSNVVATHSATATPTRAGPKPSSGATDRNPMPISSQVGIFIGAILVLTIIVTAFCIRGRMKRKAHATKFERDTLGLGYSGRSSGSLTHWPRSWGKGAGSNVDTISSDGHGYRNTTSMQLRDLYSLRSSSSSRGREGEAVIQLPPPPHPLTAPSTPRTTPSSMHHPDEETSEYIPPRAEWGNHNPFTQHPTGAVRDSNTTANLASEPAVPLRPALHTDSINTEHMSLGSPLYAQVSPVEAQAEVSWIRVRPGSATNLNPGVTSFSPGRGLGISGNRTVGAVSPPPPYDASISRAETNAYANARGAVVGGNGSAGAREEVGDGAMEEMSDVDLGDDSSSKGKMRGIRRAMGKIGRAFRN